MGYWLVLVHNGRIKRDGKINISQKTDLSSTNKQKGHKKRPTLPVLCNHNKHYYTVRISSRRREQTRNFRFNGNVQLKEKKKGDYY
jgi:hypothetical protein